ncbi:hypothetical protein VITU102760_24865 [Vibrio tubiashii]|uniref:Uncharacterized protein n=1 Tax=Vibrio tubiashii ATCC 19109 TaxID=1051646 RepID=F9T6R9_9VIBR|nr:hypothetical protein [Vibrio tubiashii]AIW17483.1 hypothetical protein IX91_25845 [Vibrio tubiashii ATCC 19109]EGU54474.1 hypothetical protein VITU9109_02832 [Vibrio tubiashii ATCC 19109]EIF06003.1 hypothetical protein VT1337_00650 [Vibrio tubiashii NCIMB 1337 = ATCC 19106]
MRDMDEIIDARLKLMLTDTTELLGALQALPKEFDGKTQEVIALVEAMKKAVATVPNELDVSFNSKINRVLDLANEIDRHTVTLEKMLERKIPTLLDEHAKAIKKNVTPPYLLVFFVGVIGSVVGSAFTLLSLSLM